MNPVQELHPVIKDWWRGKVYSQNSTGQKSLAEELLSAFLFKGDETVLDIGCGSGSITLTVAKEKTSGRVIGLDASFSMIEQALAYNQTNLSFQQGFAESFQMNALFDLIVSFSTFHWIKDQEATWKNIRNHLKIGGHALISLNPHPREKNLAESIEDAMLEYESCFANYTEEQFMPHTSIEAYKLIIEETGLHVNECKQTIRKFIYNDKLQFVNSIKAWLPHLSLVPPQEQDRFVDLIATKFMNRTNQKDLVELPYNHFYVLATRIN